MKTYITYFDDKQIDEYGLTKTEDTVPFKGNDTSVSGESINHLNNFYCELTTLYWVWQNTIDELLCFKQYRRPFETELRPQKGEIVTYAPIRSIGLYQEYCYYHGSRRGNEVTQYLIGKFGKESKEVMYWLKGDRMFTNNTFIIHREDFNKMCEFIFNVLFDLEEKWGLGDDIGMWLKNARGYTEDGRYDYQQHFMAYIGERLVSMYINCHMKPICVERPQNMFLAPYQKKEG